MSLHLEVGTIIAPAGTGNQTYNLVDGGFGPVKVLILWAAYNTAAGDVDGHGIFSMGHGTYRGGTPQRAAVAFFDTDAVGTSDSARGRSEALILRGLSAATPTVDYEADLVSLDNAAFTLNWTDAPASQIKINYMVFGGDDVTDALATTVDITTAAGTQDVTVATDFGNPDLLLALSSSGATGNQNGNNYLGLGVGVDDANEAHSCYTVRDAQPSMDVASDQRATFLNVLNSSISTNMHIELSARSAWPTDGFQVNKVSAPTGSVTTLMYLAIRGTFSKVIGFGTVPTAAAPQTQDLPVGSTPRGALFFHNSVPANAGIETTHADLGTFGLGATDGTHEAWAGVGNDDGNANSIAHRHHSESKVIRMLTPSAAGTVASEADGSISGDNVRLAWPDTDTVAREYGYLLLGDARSPRYPIVNFQDPAVL